LTAALFLLYAKRRLRQTPCGQQEGVMPLKIETARIEKPWSIGKMGTSGLRLVQEDYNRPLFLEQFAQGVADYFVELTNMKEVAENNKTLIIGGDPRKGNADRVRRIAEIMVGNGFRVIIAKDSLASTPAMSHTIRECKAAGGIILTASHNPFTDVGIKLNMSSGAPALEETVARVHAMQNEVKSYSFVAFESALEAGQIECIDCVKLYADLLDEVLHFGAMRDALALRPGFAAAFDAMHGAAGPFAHEVFINRLGLDATILREEPREDLGGLDAHGHPLHPEPDFDYIGELIKLNATGKYDIVAAWDSDVDRRLDGGKGFFIESADEFALFSKYAELIGVEKLFPHEIYFGRSTVTAGTIDLMQGYLEKKFPKHTVHAVETPTGFKWIAELGNWGVEESNGVGNPYIREKDGIFATAFLLKILLETGKTVQELMEGVWKEFGRVFFTRGEVSGSDENEKTLLTSILKDAAKYVGGTYSTLKLEKAGSWDYIHPKTKQAADTACAFFLQFSEGNTIKARFSGTGSGGYTLRVYCTKYDTQFARPKSPVTQPMKDAFDAFLAGAGFSGKSKKYTDANQPDPYTG
jgi:phosphoglucomutase